MENQKMLFCFLLLLAWGYAGEGGVISGPGHHAIGPGYNWIPQRCIDMSHTNVSCSNVGSDSLLPHPDDCRLFYYCLVEVPICRECPAGLHFNPTKHVCDKPHDAGCVRPQTATPGPGNSSTTPVTSNSTRDPLTTFVTLK